MEIAVYTDRPEHFWIAMGPHFASKAIRADLPALCDAPGYVWFLTMDGEALLAFASVDIDAKGVGHLRNLWVAPERRGEGVASALMEARLDYLQHQGVRTARTSRRVSKDVQFAENHGFRLLRNEGNWQILEIDLWERGQQGQGGIAAPVPQEATPLPADLAASRKAGQAAARKAMAARTAKGLHPLKARPSRKDFAAHTGERWDAFVAGWVETVAQRQAEAT